MKRFQYVVLVKTVTDITPQTFAGPFDKRSEALQLAADAYAGNVCGLYFVEAAYVCEIVEVLERE